MSRIAWIVTVTALVARNVAGQAVVSVDTVDPSDGISQPPPGVVAFDVLVDIAPTDTWTAAGLVSWTFEGARFRYNYVPLDPNEPDWLYPDLIAPGVENRFVTFASRPRIRDADARFLDEGVAAAGQACMQPPFVLAQPTMLDIAWFRTPPAGPETPSFDGAIFRVALDVAAACVPGDIVVAYDQPPPGWSPILLSTCGNFLGTAVATFDHPQLVQITWGAYVDTRMTCLGDANRDRTVELADLALLLSSFGWCGGNPGYVGCADFNGDECVQMDDLAILLANFGTDCP